MSDLFLKDENILASPPIVGHNILKFMKEKKVDKISIFDVVDQFKNEKWFNTKNLYFAMIFLFSLGIIDFQQSYIIKLLK